MVSPRGVEVADGHREADDHRQHVVEVGGGVQRGQRLVQAAGLLQLQAGRQGHVQHGMPAHLGRPHDGQVPAGGGVIAAVQLDQRGDAVVGRGHHRVLQLVGEQVHVHQRVVPAPRVVRHLYEGTLRLRQPDRVADMLGQLTYVSGGGHRLVAAVDAAERHGAVDAQQQAELRGRAVAADHPHGVVEQLQGAGHVAAHDEDDAADVQGPADNPFVGGRGVGGVERSLLGGVGVTEIPVRTGGEHEQPGPHPAGGVRV
ncbi:hypothetical protein [Kutzneria kofuensis]|uniref:hypothetical protein n=1 Tax=Kutzneria kofuensis TaxID=103725 RepID=UPI0031EB38E1